MKMITRQAFTKGKIYIEHSACLMLLLAMFAVSLPSCSIYEADNWRGNDELDPPDRVSGMRPIYGRADAYDVYSDVLRPITNATSVFQDGNLLFTVDTDLGIHIADNSNPSRPTPIGFVRILGVRTASATGNFLYANNFEDFVTIDITDITEVRELNRTAGFYESTPAFPPSNFRGFFECYDAGKGPLTGWESAVIDNPQCRTR